MSAKGEDLQITYRFRLPRGSADVQVDLHFERQHFEMRLPGGVQGDLPAWADLPFNQCPNCPLDPAQHPTCPAAARLAGVVPHFERVVSFDRLGLEVITPERRVSGETTAQQALSSLIGLIMAASGCPRTRFFRLMARYHLPLATEEETTLRALGSFLLSQQPAAAGESDADADAGARGGTRPRAGDGAYDLRRLADLYREVRVVNQAMARRLGAAGRTDSTINAVVILDVFAMAIPVAIDSNFEDLKPLVQPL